MFQPNSKIGDYTLKSKIGKGAFGVVWLAEKKGIIDTEFALKMPNEFDVDLDAIKREATLWKKASGHSNVLPIIEANIYDGQVVIVSEYVVEGSLQDEIDKQKNKGENIPVKKAIELLLGILSGLEHLHNRNIIHQDLKPANILLQSETPRLTDFGISGVLNSKSYVRGTSGTLPYMSPETFVGKRTVQTDIWSAGVIFYQILSGDLPFPQQDIPSIMHAIINGEPQRLSESIPQPLKNIVEKALQKKPEQRYKSALEMRKAMREIQFPIPKSYITTIETPLPDVPPLPVINPLAPTEPALPLTTTVRRSIQLILLGSIVVIIGVTILGIWYLRNDVKSITENQPVNTQPDSNSSTTPLEKETPSVTNQMSETPIAETENVNSNQSLHSNKDTTDNNHSNAPDSKTPTPTIDKVNLAIQAVSTGGSIGNCPIVGERITLRTSGKSFVASTNGKGIANFSNITCGKSATIIFGSGAVLQINVLNCSKKSIDLGAYSGLFDRIIKVSPKQLKNIQPSC